MTSLRGSFLTTIGILAVTGWALAATLWLADPTTQTVELAKAEATSPALRHPVPIGRPYLGIRGESFKLGSLTYIKILEVFPGSPAAMSGLRSESDPLRTTGDLIIKVNDHPIKSEEDFRLLLQNSVPGDVLNFLVTSEGTGSYEIIPVTLGVVTDTKSTNSKSDHCYSKASQESNQATQVEKAILSQVNRLRAENGLDALRPNPMLQKAAHRYSEKMANQNFFSHFDPEGNDVVARIRSTGIKSFRSVGENIFVGQDLTSIVDTVIQGWMASPEHKRNLLCSDYREVGTGVAVSAKRSVYVTQVYLEE